MAKKKNKNNKTYSINLVSALIAVSLIIFAFITYALLIQPLNFQNLKPNNTNNTTTSTYINAEYGFEITYPTNGQVIGTDGKMTPGKCGAAIKPTPISSYNYVLSFDNFFLVTEQNFNGSISKFMDSYPGANLFTIKQITVPGANEAFSLLKKDNASPEDLMKSPFTYTLELIKKDNKIFSIMGLQNPGNYNGCVPLNDAARNKVIDSFKFNR